MCNDIDHLPFVHQFLDAHSFLHFNISGIEKLYTMDGTFYWPLARQQRRLMWLARALIWLFSLMT